MNILQSHLKLYQRNWLSILFITLVVATAVTYVFVGKSANTHSGTLFMSIGTESNSASSSFEDFQAADQFTESLQGWFKNPALIQTIEQRSNIQNLSLNARRQEKQNLVVTYEAENQNEAQTIGTQTVTALEEGIESYNEQTGKNFTIAVSTVFIEPVADKTLLYSAIAIILGFIGGITLTYFYETLFGFISFPYQAKKILKKIPTSLDLAKAKNKKAQKVYITQKSKKAEKDAMIFPQDIQKIINAKDPIIIITPGKSKIQDLYELKTVLPTNYELVIQN